MTRKCIYIFYDLIFKVTTYNYRTFNLKVTNVTELNNIRHKLDRGFLFRTTNRAAYPYHTLERPQDPNLNVFDIPRHRKKCKEQSLLALPKAITRGTLPIREHHRKNESKVLMHKRAGVPDAFNPMEPS